ncbi:Peroxisome biosynthesis protein PAS1 [Diaporthe amygdali]|uniref:Peroxisome biosynthesis protein PAS1 n=1 Tax=Phomopsis amygdali TaxID=1214568 RepID=UPI0022FF3958|nr:Peroxisome biosynthesis protein PAS1 [Diaporthe amygdali]KAJ0108525.1 Peroxisome biosynthesis protein PAS1 [Diaporthe amygdali]
MSQRKATAAEISLVHLKNCLVNLPASLVSLLVNVNTPVQNVIVELSYRDASPTDKSSAPAPQKSIYLGWTGMPSKKKIASIVGRDGLGGSGLREQDVPLVELDPTLANTLGLHEGQKVMTTIHTDPPLAHTVNIEPLTPDDWEIIELHATFLELNLLSQIRALPNPAYSPPAGTQSSPHPLTLHLSPTSTANIRILSLEPAQSSQTPFSKIAPDAEVIVAPKVRPKSSRSSRENRSVASTSRKSGRSSTSTVRRRSQREERKPALFLRGVDRRLCEDWFDDEAGVEELTIWVDRELLVSNEFRGLRWVTVYLMRPSSLQEPAPMQGQQSQAPEVPELSRSGLRVVAQLMPWDDPPNGQTAALSTILCSAFGSEGLVGGVVKIEPAPQPLTKKSILKSVTETEDRPSVQQLKIYPFTSDTAAQALGLKFGGETKAEREEAAKRVKHIYDGKRGKSLFDGPLTDGLILTTHDGLDSPPGWEGAVVKFHPPPASQGSAKEPSHWILGSDWQLPLEFQAPIPRPAWLSESDSTVVPRNVGPLVGIDSLLEELKSHLSQLSSVLLTGALGSVPAKDETTSTHDGSRPTTANGSATGEENAWMDGASPPSRQESAPSPSGFSIQPDLDLLDIAGETDGYMPGDLSLLISRARNEAIMRSLTDSTGDAEISAVPLGRVDFENALKGFTPASLRNVTLQSSTTTFESIGGLTDTRQVLLETLQYPTKYAPIFAQCPLRLRSGILLYGYPGCGKTLLASAVAGECGLNFISVKGPEILNKYIGASEKSVRDLFERAQAAKPCVLFFDEFDSIAPKRGHDSTGVTDRVVNQLLTLMDGAEGLSGVYVLAATSRPDLIDPALLRPGRLDKSILCDFPNLEERVDIIRAIGKKAKLSEAVLESDEDLAEIARRTDGFSGADLQALISNAQLEAIQDVLKDTETVGGANGSGRRPAKRHGAGKSAGPLPHNFVQFRYGEDGSGEDIAPRGSNRSSELAEQAMIASKLESLKVSRKRAKQQRSGPNANNEPDAAVAGAKSGGDAQEKEVIIQWRHLVKALDGTRTSIGREQRTLLQRIYREFVVGRSGEMRDGQGSMEVGGRSSLM